MVVKRVAAEYANDCVNADLPCTSLCICDGQCIRDLFVFQKESKWCDIASLIFIFLLP